MYNSKVILTILFLLTPVVATAGTLLLMGVGLSGSGSPPPTCSNSLDFTDACNSQYITAIGF